MSKQHSRLPSRISLPPCRAPATTCRPREIGLTLPALASVTLVRLSRLASLCPTSTSIPSHPRLPVAPTTVLNRRWATPSGPSGPPTMAAAISKSTCIATRITKTRGIGPATSTNGVPTGPATAPASASGEVTGMGASALSPSPPWPLPSIPSSLASASSH